MRREGRKMRKEGDRSFIVKKISGENMAECLIKKPFIILQSMKMFLFCNAFCVFTLLNL